MSRLALLGSLAVARGALVAGLCACDLDDPEPLDAAPGAPSERQAAACDGPLEGVWRTPCVLRSGRYLQEEVTVRCTSSVRRIAAFQEATCATPSAELIIHADLELGPSVRIGRAQRYDLDEFLVTAQLRLLELAEVERANREHLCGTANWALDEARSVTTCGASASFSWEPGQGVSFGTVLVDRTVVPERLRWSDPSDRKLASSPAQRATRLQADPGALFVRQ